MQKRILLVHFAFYVFAFTSVALLISAVLCGLKKQHFSLPKQNAEFAFYLFPLKAHLCSNEVASRICRHDTWARVAVCAACEIFGV
jgi:hypothetical protein